MKWIGEKVLFLTFFFILPMISFGVLGQEKPTPQTCEYLKNALDQSLVSARENENSFLILIFRPGSDERSTSYSRNRTKFIKRYLHLKDGVFSNLIIAQSEPSSKLGRLEIYISGEKRWDMYFVKNRSGFDSCVE